MSDKPENMIPKIEKEKQEEQKKSQKDRNGIIGGLVFGAISFFFAYQAYKILFEFLIGKILVGIFALLTLIFIAVSISCFFDYKESKKIEKLEEDAKREEKEFLEIDPEKRSLRAEKLFRMNQKEAGKFQWPRTESEVRSITSQQFRWLMEGLTTLPKKQVKRLKKAPDYTV